MVVVGSEIDDPELISLIEDSGALVVADRFCYGSFPGRQEIVLTDDEDALTQVCRNYLQTTLCVRHSAQHKVQKRLDFAAQLAKDFHADGIIYEQIKFCTYWSYERALASHIMHNEYNIPTLSIDRPYMSRTSGQLRTRGAGLCGEHRDQEDQGQARPGGEVRWRTIPKPERGLGNLYSADHRCTKRREWKGLKDTLYDYGRWLKLLGMLGVKLGPVLPQFLKGLKRYRWLVSYITTPAFLDRPTPSACGAMSCATPTSSSTPCSRTPPA